MTETEQKESYFSQHVKQEFPADKSRWTKTTLITLQEALFLSYGVEPPTNSKPTLLLSFDRFIEEVDIFHIYELSRRAVDARELRLVDNVHVKSIDFVNWAKSFDLPIKTEFFFFKTTSEMNEDENISSNGDKREKRQTLRIQVFRAAAQLHWRREEDEISNPQSNLKEYTGPSELAISKNMAELATVLNRIGGLKPVQGSGYSTKGVDPEWFSDLYPGKTKPGPKPKKSKKQPKTHS